jgi:hypothetical protein
MLQLRNRKLADYTNDWLVKWIKNLSTGLGWERVQPECGIVMKLSTARYENSIELTSTSDYNEICQDVSFAHGCS